MAKVIEWNRAAPTCSIPLELAVYCINCNTISNSRPHQCAVCGSQAVLRVQPILDPDTEPPAAQRRALKRAYTHAVTNGLLRVAGDPTAIRQRVLWLRSSTENEDSSTLADIPVLITFSISALAIATR